MFIIIKIFCLEFTGYLEGMYYLHFIILHQGFWLARGSRFLYFIFIYFYERKKKLNKN
jgi:hypothetical protein